MKWFKSLADWFRAYRLAIFLVTKKGVRSEDVHLVDRAPGEENMTGAIETTVDEKGYIHQRHFDPKKQAWEEIK